jgi:carbon monoxide dehydrogenase subunit G
MPTFEHTVEIDAPITDVFEFGNDPNNWQRTTPSLTDFEVVEETDEGLSLTVTWKMLGIPMDGTMNFELVEPNGHTVGRFESPGMTGELHYHYSATENGTKVIQQCDYEFGDSLLDRVLEPVAKHYNKRQFKNSLQTSKELIEAEARVERAAGVQ